MRLPVLLLLVMVAVLVPSVPRPSPLTYGGPAETVREYAVPPGSRPHDVAPARDGGVWYTAEGSGELGHLDPATGRTRHISLGDRASPHGVIVGPDGAPWITAGGINAIVRVDPTTGQVHRFPLPSAEILLKPKLGSQ